MSFTLRDLKRFAASLTCSFVVALPLVSIGCRAGVEGWWTGSVGQQPAQLRLEQTGSLIEGEVCTAEQCVPILSGELSEQNLTITYGCPGCAFPETTLDAVLSTTRLTGEADAVSCDCPGDGVCDCRAAAEFVRCNGACNFGAPP